MKFDPYEKNLHFDNHGIEVTRLLDPYVDKKDGKVVFFVEATNLKYVDIVKLIYSN